MEVANAYTHFSQSLLAYIKSKIKSSEDAEDILQNVFTRISANVNSLSDKEKIQNWLFTVTRNAIIDYYRARAVKRNVELKDQVTETLINEDSVDATKGLDQCVYKMIELLPDDYKAIIIDSEIHGIKQKELAIKFNLAYPSLRSRVQRGRERLKQLFYNCCHIETDTRGNVLQVQGRSGCNTCEPCADQ
jgi:RNA polymerase sigma-70 factor (ECF subfamily)